MAGENDRVRIVLGGEESFNFSQYEVSQRFFAVPSAFSVRIGSGSTVKGLMAKYPPGTSYALHVGDVLQHSGRTDGYAPEDGNGATQMTLRGRDALAQLHDDHVVAERSFSNLSFKELTIACIEAAGIAGYSLVFSNDTNAKAIRNDVKVRWLHANEAADAARAGQPVFHQQITETKQRFLRAKVGQTWYAFLKKELDRAGFFLFAGPDENNFVLTGPTTEQEPAFELIRQRGSERNSVNVLRARHRNETTGRFAHYTIFGRGGGGKFGRSKVKGSFDDAELFELGLTKHYAAVDDDAKTQSQADFLARRKCAEDRRAGWTLQYTVHGHTAPLIGAAGRRGIWAVDTIVRVRDDEYGINGNLWVEGVTFRGEAKNDGATTELTLMRPEDLVFGEAA